MQARAMMLTLAATMTAVMVAGCATAPETQAERNVLEQRAEDTVARFKGTDPTMKKFFNGNVAYAVFPSVGKGAIGVGGAYGQGVLYENDRVVGYCDLSQGTVGLQLGGQKYSEIIFFETRDALLDFKAGHLEFSAQVSAVAADEGASANADYQYGVAVFTMTKGGLMYEASVGGQRFTYMPK